MSQPTYIQYVALGKLISGASYGHPIAPRTLRVLEREGWVFGGAITASGRLAHWNATPAHLRGPRPEKDVTADTPAHSCDEDCYLGYCNQMHYPEPRSIAHNSNARTGVALGELRDV